MCVFRSRYEFFFGPSLGGDGPLPHGSAAGTDIVDRATKKQRSFSNLRIKRACKPKLAVHGQRCRYSGKIFNE